MTKREQKRFVRKLLDSFKGTLTDAIDQGKIPEEWDGVELREYLYELAGRSRAHIMQIRGNERKRQYDNTIMTTTL